MKFVLILFLLCSQAYAECAKKQLRVAVLDTGFGYNFDASTNLCANGHKDFSKDSLYQVTYLSKGPHITPYRVYPKDLIGHGTNIIGIIQDLANKSRVDYCIVVIKYYSKDQSNIENLKASIEAIKYAVDLKVDIINYSGGGPTSEQEEKAAVLRFLNQGGKFISAAGNNGQNIGSGYEDYYPAMYDKRITVVGNVDKFGAKMKSSNYGKYVNRWEVGENVTGYGLTMSGTSQSTAVATGKILSENKNECILKK